MNTQQLLNEILAIISFSREDKNKLERIHEFLLDEIYEEPPVAEIPEKYKPLIAELAQDIGMGMVCYVNDDTFEYEMIPQFAVIDPFGYESMTGETIEDFDLKHSEWKNSITIEPLESFESYKIMEGFADQVPDSSFRQKLIHTLNRRKPFAHFKDLIDDSAYRQDWFDFRQAWLEEYVFGLLEGAIEEKEKTG